MTIFTTAILNRVIQMSNDGYAASVSCGAVRRHQLGSPFLRAGFTDDGIAVGQRLPVREHYILAYRE